MMVDCFCLLLVSCKAWIMWICASFWH